MGPQPGRIVRFGVFEMHAASAELRKSGVRLHLQDQPARVLLHLLERRGEIVTREELQRALWPEDTFVDFDRGLNTAVNKIRDVLGDSATSARFIETVPKRGYRFVAPVEEIAPASVESIPVPLPAVLPGRRSLRWLWAGAGLAAALAAAAALLPSRWTTADLPEPVVSPLTTLPGSEWLSSLSPDGDRVAFTWNRAGDPNDDIYVKQIGSEHLIRLTEDPGADGNPAWSPDGRWIAYARHRSGRPSELFMSPAMGGAETKLTEFFGGSDVRLSRFVSWGPNSRWMIITDRLVPRSDVYALYYLSVESREKRRLTSPPTPSLGDTDPAVSPDGKSVAFSRRYASHRNELYLLHLTGEAAPSGAPVRLLPNSRTYRSPAWTADGRDLVFQSGWLHLPSLSRLSMGESSPVLLAFAGEFAGLPSTSLRGNRMSFRRGMNDINIWALRLGEPSGHRLELWNGSSSYLDHVPQFSPDGRRVAFMSNRDGIQALWVSDADGSRARRLTNFTDAEVTAARWTADGAALSFVVRTGGGTTAYLVDLDGGSPKPVVLTGHNPISISQSRNGKSWFLDSGRTGRREAWTIPVHGGSSVQITKNGGCHLQESSDGKYLYYSTSEAGRGLWRVPVNGGREERVLESLATPMSFQVMEEGIYYIPEVDSAHRSSIQLYRFATGRSETLVPLGKLIMWGFTVSPDRRTILYVQSDSSAHDQMLVDNFR